MPNLLQFEKSPYLQQHKDNPVDWKPWGQLALEEARAQNKLIFLSIGYATCHWCHVMEHESFESEEVAGVLNQNFISIKVDREELPDIDQIYMSALHAMGQRGGWPLSMFLTPDLKPVLGGTYFPKNNFLNTLEQIAALWRERPDYVQGAGEALVEFLKTSPLKNSSQDRASSYTNAITRYLERNHSSYDAREGGFGSAPKFPPYLQVDLLLRLYHRNSDRLVLEMVENTLKKMAGGGIYDQIGGGFARYSVDNEWLVPHFEKMLYTQALLARNYVDTFLITQNPFYKEIACETLDYVLRDMTSPDGAFYSAEDADSKGADGKPLEGLFYTFTEKELKEVLNSDQIKWCQDHFGVSEKGNFEHNLNVLNLKQLKLRETPQFLEIKAKLLELRGRKRRPLRDEKVLTSWNALMITTFARAGRALGQTRYIEAAERAFSFVTEKLIIQDGQTQVFRRWCLGEVKHEATLDDFAFLIEATISLYQSTFKNEYFDWAIRLQEQQDQDFWDHQNGSYFYTSARTPNLILRVKDASDDALPNANALSALNLAQIYALTLQAQKRDRAETILDLYAEEAEKFPIAFHTLLTAYDFLSHFEQIVLAPPDGEGEQVLSKWIQRLSQRYSPTTLTVVAKKGAPPVANGKTAARGRATVYRCQDGSCQNPSFDLD